VAMFLCLSSIGSPSYKIVGMKDEAGCTCTGNYTAIKDGDSCAPKDFLAACSKLGGYRCSIASCHYIGLTAPKLAQYFKYLNVVGFFWLLFFISGFSEMVLAGTFAQWYWTVNKSDVPFFTVTGSVYRTLRFHLGTIAFGSLILTICRIIRLLIEYVDQKLKKYNNELTRAVLCCCRCVFWCLENFLKFLNRNAYIMCAIHGKNFCSSARDSFNLLMRNVLRVVALDKTTDFLFFLSKLLISLGMAASCFTYLTSDLFNQHFPHIFLHYPIAQVVLIFIGSYIIASVFFSVYSMAVDTLFLCFCEYFHSDTLRLYFNEAIHLQWRIVSATTEAQTDHSS
jgi:choline transporter-like protein 2/4/5